MYMKVQINIYENMCRLGLGLRVKDSGFGLWGLGIYIYIDHNITLHPKPYITRIFDVRGKGAVDIRRSCSAAWSTFHAVTL